MTNYEAIRQMTPSHMAEFLDQVYLTGLNRGMCAEKSKDDSLTNDDPFDLSWLKEDAEEATRYGVSEDGDLLLLNALAETILQNAGIEISRETE